MANNLNVTELDFDQIKDNLKNFLKSQSEYNDYDFDGSGLSVLLDVLAYNTHYNAVNAHYSLNEAFLDSAQIRGNVVTRAKLLTTPFCASIKEMTGWGVFSSISTEFAPLRFRTLRANSMTAICIPKQIPKNGMLFSRT